MLITIKQDNMAYEYKGGTKGVTLTGADKGGVDKKTQSSTSLSSGVITDATNVGNPNNITSKDIKQKEVPGTFKFNPAMEQRILAAKDRQNMRIKKRRQKLVGGGDDIKSQFTPTAEEGSKLYEKNLATQNRLNKVDSPKLDKKNLKESKPYKPTRKDIKSAQKQVEEDRMAKIAKDLKEGGMGQSIRQSGADIGYIPGDVEMFDESMEADAGTGFIDKDLTAYDQRIANKKAKDKSVRQEIEKDAPALLQTSLMNDDDTDADTSFAADDIKEGQRSRREDAFKDQYLKSKIGKIDKKGRSVDAVETQRGARRAKGLGMGAMIPGKEFNTNLPPNAHSAISTLFPTQSQQSANKLASQKLMQKKMNSGLGTLLSQISKSL